MNETRRRIIEIIGSMLNRVAASDRPFDDDKERTKILKKLGWHFLGMGAFKTAWAKDGLSFVFKTFSTTYSDTGGAYDVENYEKCPPEIKLFLLPVLAHGRGWIAQERVNIPYSYDARKHLCLSHGCDGELYGIMDGGYHNHTHREDGTPVLYDYGQSDQWDVEEFLRCQQSRLLKEKHPEHYCPVKGCLWRVKHPRGGPDTPCRKHNRDAALDRWVRRYDNLNGAPESEDDR